MFNTEADDAQNKYDYQHPQQQAYAHPYQQYEQEVNGGDPLDDDEVPRSAYHFNFELEYQPDVVRWLRSSSLSQQIDGEEHALIVAGHDHRDNHYVQRYVLGRDNNNDDEAKQREMSDDDVCSLMLSGELSGGAPSKIAAMALATEQSVVAALRNGQLLMLRIDDSDSISIQSTRDCSGASALCAPSLCSVAVNSISGKVVASDEAGSLFIADAFRECAEVEQRVQRENSCSSAINAVRFANSEQIASVSMSGQLLLWDLRDLRNVCFAAQLQRKIGALTSLAVHPHRNHLFATGAEHGDVALWDVRGAQSVTVENEATAKPFSVLSAHSGLLGELHFARKGGALLTCSDDGLTQLFHVDDWNGVNGVDRAAWNANRTELQSERYPIRGCDFYEPLDLAVSACANHKLCFMPI